MSKSKGTGMAPQQVSGTLGAEILRLWVASSHYSGELTISNDGVTTAADTDGYGLVGMRERVNLYGGKLEAGPRVGGGFSVSARLPLEVAR